MLSLPFDPLKRAKEVEELVMEGSARKYYRFRAARYYGGIATGDLVGCPFLCAYCWNYGRNLHPERSRDKYYAPDEVAGRLVGIMRRKRLNKVRLSGAEPILGDRSFEHLNQVLKLVYDANPICDFILETNGLLIGYEPSFVQELSRFDRLHVRVSMKGFDEESYEAISGSNRGYFDLPIRGLRAMMRNGLSAWPAVMFETFGPKGIGKISQTLKDYGIRLEELEVEYLEPYPFVLENLQKRSISLHR